MLDLIKNRKKSQYAGSLPSATDGKGLFVVRLGKQTAKDLFADPIFVVTVCRPPRTAKKPRGSQLCFLGADPFGQFAYSGRRQRLCHQWQTAKNLPSSDVYMTS